SAAAASASQPTAAAPATEPAAKPTAAAAFRVRHLAPKFVSATATDCVTATANGGERAVSSGAATFTATAGALGLVLCYKLGAEPYVRYPAITADALIVSGPTSSVAAKGIARTLTFSGIGLAANDRAFWAATTSPIAFDCAGAEAAATSSGLGGVQAVGANLAITFTFTIAAAELRLCWKYGIAAAFKYYPAARLVVAELTGPSATLAVAGAAEPVSLAGVGVAAGDTAYWVGANADCSAGSSPSLGGVWTVGAGSVGSFTPTATGAGSRLCYSFSGLPYVLHSALTLEVRGLTGVTRLTAEAAVTLEPWYGGGLRTVAGAQAIFTWARGSGGVGFCLCYRFGTTKPFRLYLTAAFTASALEVTSPPASIAVQRSPRAFTFVGVGVAIADAAFWLPSDAGSVCDPTLAAGDGIKTVGADGVSATFTFEVVRTGLRLCYRFGATRSFTLFAAVATSVVLPDDPFAYAKFTSILPTGAALNVNTLVTIYGSGFEPAVSKVALIRCIFGNTLQIATVGVSLAAAVGAEPILVSSLDYYDNAIVSVAQLAPAGLPQGISGVQLTVRGTNFKDYGRLRWAWS
ncbi:hypothetical protein T492DRAFT_905143, partial [Pavlovales sp. CCMP2436]